MSPRTKKQFEEIRKSSREKILSVALELFAQNGYQGTSISQISKKAKISKGLMYNYFKNKEKLLEEIVVEGFNKIAELDLALNHLQENFKYWQLYTALLVQPHVQKKFEKKFYEFRELFIASLSEIFAGLGSNNPQLEAFLLGMHFDGLALNFVTAPDDFPIEEIKIALYEKYSKSKREKRK